MKQSIKSFRANYEWILRDLYQKLDEENTTEFSYDEYTKNIYDAIKASENFEEWFFDNVCKWWPFGLKESGYTFCLRRNNKE